MPEPTGTLLSDSIRAGKVIPARWRTKSRLSETLFKAGPEYSVLLMVKQSPASLSSKVTVVMVCRSPRFIDKEGLAGKRSSSFSLPQYLIKAILG